ncbi:MAG: hypothetical protein QOH13_445, partial [Thermoleophilaceae bacterium]|nr:hypothetical protein [Thermoleophilaceae bacterium]
IDDLLGFARLGRTELSLQQVEPGPLARQVLGELELDSRVERIESRVGDLPACDADPALLHQVFTNLISNAMKFSALSDHPLVEVGSVGSNGGVAYFVRDNGIGFDVQYSERMFGVFERLQAPEEYEGTGVGLAIVQRAVKKHGGRVWAEAEPGHGATFFFTLKPDNGGST